MKIALQFNGLYVSADKGGGIDTRNPETPVAVRADRTEVGAWETLNVIKLDSPYVAIQTVNGNYFTAEEGGGGSVRTNATEIGPWEKFIPIGSGTFICWHGTHFLTVEPGDDPIVSARDVIPRFDIITLEAPEPPIDPIAPADLDDWRGSFCIPNALPGIPYGDGQNSDGSWRSNARIWTPAYGCYDDVWRTAIRDAYRQRGYTHFVYNCAGLPYGDDYPELADDAARVRRDLIELIDAGLVPVVCATDDRNPWVVCQSFSANKALIPICFPVWEMNGPLGNPDKAIEEQNCKDAITRTRTAAPNAKCYLHFTPGHGSISYASEIDGWKWCQAAGTTGLLAQGDNRFAAEDPKTGGEGLQSTAVRLLGLPSAPAAWAGLHQLTVKFEYGISDMYHASVSEAATRQYTADFLRYAPDVVGFCDGGPAKVSA